MSDQEQGPKRTIDDWIAAFRRVDECGDIWPEGKLRRYQIFDASAAEFLGGQIRRRIRVPGKGMEFVEVWVKGEFRGLYKMPRPLGETLEELAPFPGRYGGVDAVIPVVDRLGERVLDATDSQYLPSAFAWQWFYGVSRMGKILSDHTAPYLAIDLRISPGGSRLDRPFRGLCDSKERWPIPIIAGRKSFRIDWFRGIENVSDWLLIADWFRCRGFGDVALRPFELWFKARQEFTLGEFLGEEACDGWRRAAHLRRDFHLAIDRSPVWS